MREIKFRAKAKDPVIGWVYGDFAHVMRGVTVNQIEVLEETVCQYTGIKDRNGKEIYEGDILGCNHFRYEVVWKEGGLLLRHSKVELYQFVSSGALMDVVGNVYDNKDLLTNK